MKGNRQCEGGGWGWGQDVFVIGREVEVLNMSSGQVRSLLPPTTVQSCSGAEIQVVFFVLRYTPEDEGLQVISG